MAKKIKIIQERIDFLIKYQNVYTVAELLNLSVSPLYRYYNRLIKEGYLIKENGLFLKGHKSNEGYSKRSQIKVTKSLELHGTRLLIPILNPSSNWQKNKERFLNFSNFQKNLEYFKPNPKFNQTNYNFSDIPLFHIITTPKSFILVQKKEKPLTMELTKEAPILLKERLLNLVSELIPILEKRFLEKLSKDFETNIYLNRQHYAFLKNPLAHAFVKNRMALKVFDEEDNKLRTVVDISKGVIHFEQVHDIKAQLDAEAHARFIKNINTGEFNEERVINDIDSLKGLRKGDRLIIENNYKTLKYFGEDLRAFFQIQEKFSKSQGEYAKNIQEHIQAIKDLGKGVREYTKAVKKFTNKKI